MPSVTRSIQLIFLFYRVGFRLKTKPRGHKAWLQSSDTGSKHRSGEDLNKFCCSRGSKDSSDLHHSEIEEGWVGKEATEVPLDWKLALSALVEPGLNFFAWSPVIIIRRSQDVSKPSVCYMLEPREQSGLRESWTVANTECKTDGSGPQTGLKVCPLARKWPLVLGQGNTGTSPAPQGQLWMYLCGPARSLHSKNNNWTTTTLLPTC